MTKVLIVDDMPGIASLMAKNVAAQGYEPLVAHDGFEALRLAAAEQPDAILLDVMMPGIDGLEVLRRLKADERLEPIPVILVTARQEADDVVAGLDAGAHDYVVKPFQAAVLTARLRSALRVRDAQDAVIRVNEQLRAEIEERKRMETELAQAQKLESIGRLAAGIAHEINTPIQYIADNARFLEDALDELHAVFRAVDRLLAAESDGPLPHVSLAGLRKAWRDADVGYLIEEGPRAVRQSLEGVEQVSTIVRAMKQFSHQGGDRKQPVHLNHAVENVLTVCRNQWKHVAEVQTALADDLPRVPCLPCELNQAVLNVVVNAAQAIAEVVGERPGEKGTITVETRRNGDWAEIRVTDTGPGIPEEIRSRVFDHFFTTKGVGKGTGQGLAITRAIVVDKHGGSIDFETGPGRGTCFILRLPLAGASARECEVGRGALPAGAPAACAETTSPVGPCETY